MFTLLVYAKLMQVDFVGNQKIGKDELYESLDLYKPYFYEFWKKSPKLDSKTLPLAAERLKNFYKSKGFYHTKITKKIEKNRIILYIHEGKPVIVWSITVLSEFDLSRFIPFKKGAIFSAKEFEKSKKDIKKFYEKKGYCKVNLNAKAWIDIVKNRAYLAYDVKRNNICRFGAVKIKSPKDIDKKIIKSLMYFKEGDIYSLDKISSTYKNFYAREGIASAIIKTDIQNSDDVNTTVEIVEIKKPIRFQIGLGVNSDEGIELSLGVKNRNFHGNLKTISFNTRYTDLKQSASVDFDMPLANKKSFGSSLEGSNEKFLGFKEEKISETIFLKYRNKKEVFQKSLVLDFSKIYDSGDLIAYPQGSFFFTSPKISWIYDRRDDILSPTKGYFVRAEVMGSVKSFASDATYCKYSLEGGLIVPLSRNILAFKVNYGSLKIFDGAVPASYRFYAGGMNSNRAYTYRKLGPQNSDGDPLGLDSVLEFTAEYRFPIYGDFRGVVFSDNTYIGEGEVPDFDKCYNSAGFGLRYKTPIGPIAFDFGFDVSNPSKQYAFHFRIGELF